MRLALAAFSTLAFALACSSPPRGGATVGEDRQGQTSASEPRYFAIESSGSAAASRAPWGADREQPHADPPHGPDPTARPPKAATVSKERASEIASANVAAGVRLLGKPNLETAILTSNRELESGKYGEWTVGGPTSIRMDDPIWIVRFRIDFVSGTLPYRFKTLLIDASNGDVFGVRLDP